MLDHAGGKIVKFLRNLLQRFVVVAYLDLFGPEYVAVNAGNGEAALGVCHLLWAFLQDFRIYQGAAKILKVGVCV